MHREMTRPMLWVLDRKEDLPDQKGRHVISPLHYGETVEIGFVRGIEGEIRINGRCFPFKEKNVFFIPPGYLHTSVYRTGGTKKGDMVCAFHINVNELAPLIDLNRLLQKDNLTLLDLAFRCEDFDALWEIVQRISDEGQSFIAKSRELLALFERIAEQKNTQELTVEYSKVAVGLINFVEAHYAEKLSVQIAADYFGYSKQYFCKWFKGETGMTFNDFLNTVRVHHACLYLASGYSVEESAAACGFSDPSYFAKVFKRYAEMPPKAYAAKNKGTASFSAEQKHTK